ncbi:MAG TPA: hypothetical protein VFF06_07910 [Polyangia bacterium]|nr:hypothetical protein [Polyangia bacterium]
MLPGPYERWFTEACGRPAPVERRSTCDACAMLPGAPDLPPDGPFDEAVRCCTYHPHLAPHFVGAILDGGEGLSDAGRAIVRARIAARAGVTPIGLAPAPEFAAAYQRIAAEPGAFGRRRELACPFYDGGRCAIWRQRGVACAAFHCKFDRGALDVAVWNLIVVGFNAVERVLARRLLERHGLDAAACDALLHAPGDDALDARAWGEWRGREEDYFVAAARAVEPLSWADVEALGGRALAGLAEALRAAMARLDEAPPERVRRGGEILHHLGRAGGARLEHRGLPLDLVDVSAEVAARLAALGEARLADLHLDEALARRLLDWQVLVPAGS